MGSRTLIMFFLALAVAACDHSSSWKQQYKNTKELTSNTELRDKIDPGSSPEFTILETRESLTQSQQRVKNLILSTQSFIGFQDPGSCESRAFYWSLMSALDGVETDVSYVTSSKGFGTSINFRYHVGLVVGSEGENFIIFDPYGAAGKIKFEETNWYHSSFQSWLTRLTHSGKPTPPVFAGSLSDFFNHNSFLALSIGPSYLYLYDFLFSNSTGGIDLKSPLKEPYALSIQPPLAVSTQRACIHFLQSVRRIFHSQFNPDFGRHAWNLFLRLKDSELLKDTKMTNAIEGGPDYSCFQLTEDFLKNFSTFIPQNRTLSNRPIFGRGSESNTIN